MMHVDGEHLCPRQLVLSCAAFSSATCGWWAEDCMLQGVTIRSWKQACRFQLGAIIKKESMVLTSKTRPATSLYKILLLQQGHQGAQFSNMMGCSCKTPPENITQVKVSNPSCNTWGDTLHPTPFNQNLGCNLSWQKPIWPSVV